MRLPLKPHLPQQAISAAVIGERYCEALQPALLARSISVIPMPENKALDPRLSCHADLSVLQAFDGRLIVSRKVASKAFLNALSASDVEIELTDAPTGAEYPQDACLCAAIVGGFAFHNAGFSVLSGDKRLCHVNQGYAKCAVCPISENAAITSDAGLAKAMRGQGIEVLQIAPGNIVLDGFDTGFIGGSSFKLAEDVLAFTGSLDGHPDKGIILNFLQKYEIKPVFLTEKPIFDIGSAIILE